jgi:methyl-accepting chemotaxis protein
MTIGKKIALACSVLVGQAVVLGAVALIGLGRLSDSIQIIVSDSLPGVYYVGRVENTLKDIRGSMLMYVASENEGKMNQLEKEISALKAQSRELLDKYKKTITQERDRQLYEKFGPAFDNFIRTWERVAAVSRAAKTGEALTRFSSDVVPAIEGLQKIVDEWVEFNKNLGDQNAQAAIGAARTGQTWIWAVLLILYALGAAVDSYSSSFVE